MARFFSTSRLIVDLDRVVALVHWPDDASPGTPTDKLLLDGGQAIDLDDESSRLLRDHLASLAEASS